jgi:hypothetical protein
MRNAVSYRMSSIVLTLKLIDNICNIYPFFYTKWILSILSIPCLNYDMKAKLHVYCYKMFEPSIMI